MTIILFIFQIILGEESRIQKIKINENKNKKIK